MNNYFFADINGEIGCRMICKDNQSGPLVQYKDIPISKLFGMIGDHIFYSKKQYENNYQKQKENLIEVLSKYPISYCFLYKNNSLNQGISTDVLDFSMTGGKNGTGYGNKPSKLNRVFNKQVLIVFKFEDKIPPWIEDFKMAWKQMPITLNSFKGTVNKDYGTDLEDNILIKSIKNSNYGAFYSLSDLVDDSEDARWDNSKTMYMLNSNDINKSVLVSVQNKKVYNKTDLEESLENLKFTSTKEFIGVA